MSKAKGTGMWGLELSEDRLRLVHVSPRRNGCELNHAVRITLESGSSDQDIADVILRVIEGSNLNCRSVALCLGGADGDLLPIQSQADGGDDDFAGINISLGDRRSCFARGRVSAARRLSKIVELAGLEAHSIIPTQAALAVSGELLIPAYSRKRKQEQDLAKVAVFVGTTRIIMMLVADRQIKRCRIAPRSFATDRYDHDVRAAVLQFFSAISSAKEANGSWPRSCDIYADGLSAEELRHLSETLGISCRACTPAMGHGLLVSREFSAGVASYCAGVGACMSALGISPLRVDLSEEIFAAENKKQPRLDRKRMAPSLLTALVVISVGLLMFVRVKQKIEYQQLESQYSAIEPQREQDLQLQQQWALIQPWLSPEDDGSRAQQLQMLSKVIELFPEAHLAYVTDMQIDTKVEGDVIIDIKGRSINSEVLHECVSRLNESGKFTAQLGTVSDIEQSRDYPKKYSITVTLTRKVEDAG